MRHGKARLLNLLKGVVGSFCSRNNDIEGYWAIGKFCRHAFQKNSNQISLNLFENSLKDEMPNIDLMKKYYHSLLIKLLEKHAYPSNYIKSMMLELEFNIEQTDSVKIYEVTRGNLYKCTCIATDIKGIEYKFALYGYCEPYDPNKEFKSGRVRLYNNSGIS